MKNNLEQHRRLAELGRRDESIYEFLALTTWTPAMAALLVSGIRPAEGSVQIPDKGIGLDGQTLSGSTSRFHQARRILGDWNDWVEDGDENRRSASASGVHPMDFFEWCDDEGIETDWLDLFRTMAGCPTAEQIATASSPLLMFSPPNPLPTPAPGNADCRSDNRQTEAAAPGKIVRPSARRNALSSAIDKAIELAGNDVPANVFFQLRGLALEVYPPFTGIVEKSSLHFTDGDKPKSLSRSGLGKRLERRRKRL